MKLQKLLLRWSPPGLGLQQLHEDGSESILHKDLPDRENVVSADDVVALVDELLASEPELLARKRSTLTKQLGRLYDVELVSPSRHSSKDSTSSHRRDSTLVAPDMQLSPLDGPVEESMEEPESEAVAEMTSPSSPYLESWIFKPSVASMMLPLRAC
mmetsp:Transcript_76847/g.135409  ORF Transcript_76847/g.135409 Transcript_76847/m.135409 type:complete len:157 (+) Transcript_76847:78-548(+)